MKKYNLVVLTLFVVILTLPLAASAENDSTIAGWRINLVVDVTTTQTAYSDSWVGGEVGSFNWVGNLNGSAEKKLAPWFDLSSTLRLSFGQTVTQDTARHWSKPHKSTDLIDWENVGRFLLDKYVDPYVGLRLESQFLDARVPEKHRYLTPLTLTESGGIARMFYKKDDDQVLSRMGLALRQTFKKVIIDSTTFATTDSTLTDGGLEWVTDVRLTFKENLIYTSKLSMYKAFFFSQKDKVKETPYADDWKAVDVNWENFINAAITKVIAVNLYTQFLYDKQVSHRGRVKETLGLGLTFKLM